MSATSWRQQGNKSRGSVDWRIQHTRSLRIKHAPWPICSYQHTVQEALSHLPHHATSSLPVPWLPKPKVQVARFASSRPSSRSTCISIVVGGNTVLLGLSYIPEATNSIYPYPSISLYCYFIPATSDLCTITVDPVAAIRPKVSDILHGISGF